MVNSYIRKSDLDSEMTVVRNEFESGENNPQLVLYGKMLATAYQWHNYGHLPIGARSDIENVEHRAAAGVLPHVLPAGQRGADRRRQVRPRRDAGAAIAKYFGPIPKPARTLPAIYTADPVQDGERTVTLRRAGNSKFLGMMFHTVRGAHPDYVATDVLGDIADDRARRAPVQVAGGDQEGDRRGELTGGAARPRHADAVRADSGRRRHRARRATRCSRRSRTCKKEPITEAEVARIRAKAAKYFDEIVSQSAEASASRFPSADRARRLAPLLPAARPLPQRDRRRRAARRARLPQALQRDASANSFRTRSPTARRCRRPSTSPRMVKDYKGDADRLAGRGIRHQHRQPRRAHAALHAAQRHEGRAAAQEDPRRSASTSRWRCTSRDEKSAFGKQAARRSAPASMLMRGTTKRNRQEIEDALDKLRAQRQRQRQRNRRVGYGPDVPQGTAGHAAAGRAKCCASRRSRRRSSTR